MTRPLRVPVAEDSEDGALSMLRELRKGGFVPVYKRVQTAEACLNLFHEKRYRLI